MIDYWKTKPIKIKLLKVKGLTVKGESLFPSKRNIDSDFDGTPDWRDCRPHNPLRQDLSEREQAEMLVKLSEELEGEPQPEQQKPLNIYIFEGGKWFWAGTYAVDENFEAMIQELKRKYGDKLIIDERDNLEDKLNRELRKRRLEQKFSRTKEYAHRQQFLEHAKKGLKIDEKEYQRFIKRYLGRQADRPPIRGFQGQRRLTPEEKLSPNYQQKSIFPLHSPYRPLSSAQCLPKLAMITSPTAERMRTGEPYEFPLKNISFMPPFVGFTPRRREVEYEELR